MFEVSHEEIWLLQFKYDSHSHYAKWTYGPNIFANICQKKPNCNNTAYIIAKYVPETNSTLKCHICQLVHVQISDIYVIIYTSYEFSATKSVTRSTTIHTFYIIGI